MSETTDRSAAISAAVRGNGAEAGEAYGKAEKLLETLRDKYEEAAQHGWGGVAGNIGQSVEALEKTVEALDKIEKGCTETGTVLDKIDEKMSTPEVATHLGEALSELEGAVAAGTSADIELDEAITHSRAAGLETLPLAMSNLRDELAELQADLKLRNTDVSGEKKRAEKFETDVEHTEREPAKGRKTDGDD